MTRLPAASKATKHPAHSGTAETDGHLTLLAEMMRGFACSGDFVEVLRAGLARIAESLGAEASSMFLLEGEAAEPEIVCSACSGPVDITGLRLSWGAGIVGRCIASNATLMVRDVRKDPGFAGGAVDAATGFRTRSILVAPLSLGEERLGAIEIINKRRGSRLFSSRDQALLETLCHAASLAIANMRLTARFVEQERMNRELELAAAIQRDLLPPPAPAGFPAHGLMRPMYRVSGDFYDVIERPDGRLWFCVADVSGKGMNAALLMARTSSLFRCLAKQAGSPGELAAAINAELCETVSHGMFVTLACGLYDPVGGGLRLANAGHEPALLHDQVTGAMRVLEAGSPPLGIAPGLVDPAAEWDLRLGPGQALYIFTDGLTEAADAQGRMLEGEGVAALIAECAVHPPHQRPVVLLEGVMGQGRIQRDDLTVLIVAGPRAGVANS
jgi:sigma-B regulation protein RsbU (phosphoserine phosphatase)